ncbi:hypothetical protein F5I97DRAFT_1079075 [Phlebopus sp. FC_14]|nr:hypothetical protein F5I97DRAFT_1079075 [Phlebopus sp. FC_14]
MLNTGSSASEPVWSSRTTQTSKETPMTKTNGTGEVDHVATALGALGLRRANKNQNGQAEEKKNQGSSNDQRTSSAASGRKPSQSTTSHRHPGPISLPPPTNFSLPHPVMLSPHTHPRSPIYHPGYPLSPMQHPMGSPLHHPMGSPLHHPVHVHSPLHHPGHPQYGTYPPMHYGVMTPHGLPPITPSMPPFTFLPPQAQGQGQSQGQNGQGREERTSDDSNSDQSSRSEGGQSDGHNEATPPQAPPPSYYSHPPHALPLHMPYSPNVHPTLFSPGIPLSPGIMMPLSPGVMVPPVSMSMSMPSVPMTPGVAMTPGVTMTPGAFWPHAPWINPAVGAPVHVHADGQGGHQHPGGEGYFPPVGKPGGDTGYFPPVPSVANEILKEGSGFGSPDISEGHANGSDGTGSESRSPSTNMSRTSPSPDTSHEDLEGGTIAQPIKRTSSVQCEGGFSKRGSLLHRESAPAMTMTSNGGDQKKRRL